MRRLAERPELNTAVTKKLLAKSNAIAAQPSDELKRLRARSMFNAARGSAWFDEVVAALRKLSGHGQLCMYCSANEPSQLEHYKPLTAFPELAFAYLNYLWTCDICNRTFKGQRFPPNTEQGAQILNPLDDNVWDFFFLDDNTGWLVPRVDPQSGEFLVRAESTRDVVGLDRETLQLRRHARFNQLKSLAIQLLHELSRGEINEADAKSRVATWRIEPFQADVADYFLNGPGRTKEPFGSLFIALPDI